MFLAISGLMLVGALVGVNTNINNSRFNDAVRSTTSYLQAQYNEVASGLNDRGQGLACDASGNITTGGPGNPTQEPGMSNCVIMGRFLKLEGSDLTARYITGNRATLSGLPADDTLAIRAMNPRVAGSLAFAKTYAVPWQIGVVNTTISTTPSGTYDAVGFAIIRSPASGNVVYYAYGPLNSPEPTQASLLTLISAANLSKALSICFADDTNSRVGRVTIGSGQGQEVIQTDLANGAACP